MKNLPLGIQELSRLRENNCIYVDKTENLHQLISRGTAYFLSRPRRFGKSLTVSTLREIFEGNKQLFDNTWIQSRWDWSQRFPVIHLDFSKINHKDLGLTEAIEKSLFNIAQHHNIQLSETTIALQFAQLIQNLSVINKVVVLIDEYDKPIIDYIENPEQANVNRDILRNFFSILKGSDRYLKFLFFTGVSKFSKVSVFSELNHLTDISFNNQYATMLGYTYNELVDNFPDYLDMHAQRKNISRNQLLDQLREWYNGYSWDGETSIYNPFGFLSFLANGNFRDYWFASATPTYLLKLLKTYDFLPQDIDNVVVGMSIFDKYDLPTIDIRSLFVETGYLTIKKKIDDQHVLLGYPNREVAMAFSTHFLGDIAQKSPSEGESILFYMQQSLINNDLNGFELQFNALFPGLTYMQMEMSERYFHSIFYLVVKMLGFNIESEILTNIGRMDCVIKTKTHIYIIEFKKGSSKAALEQIQQKNYHQRFLTDTRQILLLGIGFNQKTKKIAKFAKAEISK